jgi:hypothetical protein
LARIWVLDTETKGTGAHMVPLERSLEKPAPKEEPLFVPPKPKPRQPKADRWRLLTLDEQRVLWNGRHSPAPDQ